MSRSAKKLAAVLATSTSMTEASKEVDPSPLLKRVACIHHPVRFKKNQAKVQTLIDYGSEVNAITLAYAAKLDLKVRPTNVGTQKIDGSTLATFEMVLASF